MMITDIPAAQDLCRRLCPRRCLDISVRGMIYLLRRKGGEGRGVGEGLGQRDNGISQASSQAGECHSLLRPLDIEHVRLMQRKGKEGKSR